MTKQQLIQRRVSKGYNATQSEQLLEELINTLDGYDLVYALVYEEFATEKQAYKFTDIY